MDDVLKSGHFSILTISICAVFVQNVSRSLQAALVVSEVLRTKVGFIHTTTSILLTKIDFRVLNGGQSMCEITQIIFTYP